ncbi:MAG: hypothetical protein P8Y00_00030 [Deltaproteobacteria bacterium]
MLRSKGYVKNPDNFEEGCFYGDYAHNDIPHGEEWTLFEAVATNGNLQKPTGYMASGYSAGAIRLLPNTYSQSREEALKKAYKVSVKFRWVTVGNLEDVFPVQVSIGDYLPERKEQK